VRITAIETCSKRYVHVVRAGTADGSEAQAGLFSPARAVEDGCRTVPDGPGSGVEISPSWPERAQRVVSEA
jgi:L-alanine-DL-glutamate epimerase-like enolase superfamily enzyme